MLTQTSGAKGHIVSLFDYSGNWPRYFGEDGFEVTLVDLKHGHDILSWEPPPGPVYGVLAAPPCTDFSVSGARWWAQKDLDGRTESSIALVERCLELIARMDPKFWILENPVGRIARLVPALGKPTVIVDPCDYAGYAPVMSTDCYTKRTCLWGNFTLAPKVRLEPVMITRGGKRGSWQWATLGGSSDRTKTLRSITPLGMSRATWIGNRNL